MAKKIRIEEHKESNRKKPIIWFLTINGVVGIGFIVIACMYINLRSNTVSKKEYDSMVDEKNAIIDDLEIDSDDLDSILNGESVNYIKEKIAFMNKNIVFQIKGYGNKYYTYDCMVKNVTGSYTYWAYNKEAAISNGLKAGGC